MSLGKKTPKRVLQNDIWGNAKKPVDKTVSTKERIVHVSVSAERAQQVYRERRTAIVIIILILLVGIGAIVYHSVTYADVATLYPSTCLGGWTDPQQATGEPDVQNVGDSNAFTDHNSAVLPPNTSADIFCGDFTGAIPEDSEPKQIDVHFSWNDVQSDVSPAAAASASGPVTAPAAPSDTTNTSVSSTTPATDSASSTPNDTPDSDQQPSADTASSSASDSGASTDSTDTTDTPTVPATQPSSQDPSADNPSDSLQSLLDVFATKAYAAVDASDSAATLSADSAADQSGTGFLEVEYTLDGTTWHPLGYLDAAHLEYATFSIPVTDGMTWHDLSNLQIGVKSTYSLDPTPQVYLDSMALAVKYGATKDPEPTPASGLYMEQAIEEAGTINMQIRQDGTESELVISVPNAPMGGVAVYDSATGDVKLTTNVSDSSFVLQPEYFGEGSYAIILTNDPNNCSERDYATCHASSDFVGEGEFTIVAGSSTPPVTDADIHSATLIEVSSSTDSSSTQTTDSSP